MINKIINDIEKIIKDVYTLDILMGHITNDYLSEKWLFTKNTYYNLQDSINAYTDIYNKKIVNPNHIINDYETLTQLISEFKEDIYNLFSPNLFLLIDGLNRDSLLELSNLQKDIKEEYQTYLNYENYILENKEIKRYLILLKQVLDKIDNETEKKYIPYEYIDKIIYESVITKDLYLSIYQLFIKMSKYYKTNKELLKIQKKIRFNTIMIAAGDINV